MLEKVHDLWSYPADAICITTNGFVKKNGEAVMGRGCAKEATIKIPGIQTILGRLLSEEGNVCMWLATYRFKDVFSFPVKHNWWENADIELISNSAIQMVEYADKLGIWSIAIPRPGCGNGKLKWEDVKPVLAPILDDRFVILTK